MNALTSPVEYPYLLLRAARINFAALPGQLDEEQRLRAEQQAAQECALIERVLAAPEASRVTVAEASVDEAFDSFKQGFASEADYHEALRSVGLDEESLRSALRRELWSAVVLEDVADEAEEVTEELVRKFFDANQDRMVMPEMRVVRHILVTVNPDFPENTRAAAFAKLQAVAQRLHDAPDSFPEEAMKSSECPSALEGGLLGTLPRGKLYSELEDVLFALDEGQISEITESPLGFHLLRCDEIHPARPVSYDKAAPRIRRHLMEQRRRNQMKSWLAGLAH